MDIFPMFCFFALCVIAVILNNIDTNIVRFFNAKNQPDEKAESAAKEKAAP